VFLVKNSIFGWVCPQDTWCLEKGCDKPEQLRPSNLRFQRVKRYGNEHSREQIATATVSWSILSSHVCKISINEGSLIIYNN
jgi:hypothetical protein